MDIPANKLQNPCSFRPPTTLSCCLHRFAPQDSARAVLENLLRFTEGRMGDEFPGSGGSALLNAVLASDAAAKLQFTGGTAVAATDLSAPPPPAGLSAACDAGSGGASPPGGLRSCLTARQQQAVGQLMRVRALVAQFVARHDEERLQVGGAFAGCLRAQLLSLGPQGAGAKLLVFT